MEELSYLEVIGKEKKLNETVQGLFREYFYGVFSQLSFMLLVLISTILTANAPSLVSNILLKSQ